MAPVIAISPLITNNNAIRFWHLPIKQTGLRSRLRLAVKRISFFRGSLIGSGYTAPGSLCLCFFIFPVIRLHSGECSYNLFGSGLSG